jgi:hypothetical protein
MKATYVDTWLAAQALGTAIGNGITHGTHCIDYVFQSNGAANLKLVSQQIYATATRTGSCRPTTSRCSRCLKCADAESVVDSLWSRVDRREGPVLWGESALRFCRATL